MIGCRCYTRGEQIKFLRCHALQGKRGKKGKENPLFSKSQFNDQDLNYFLDPGLWNSLSRAAGARRWILPVVGQAAISSSGHRALPSSEFVWHPIPVIWPKKASQHSLLAGNYDLWSLIHWVFVCRNLLPKVSMTALKISVTNERGGKGSGGI